MDLPSSFALDFKSQIRAGTTLSVPNGIVNKTSGWIEMPDGFRFDNLMNHRRYLAPTTGQSSALGVRVVSSANNEEPTASVEDLQGRVFGRGPKKESVSLSSQYELCSLANFRIRPTTSGSGITDGVVEIDVDFQLLGKDIDLIRDDLISAVEQQTGQSITSYEHVLFCVPPGTFNGGDNEWAAFAVLGGRITFYNDIFCDKISLVIHEVGHNLRFRHSNELGEYEDKSCYMGFSYSSIGAPAMCFNGQKLFQSGWFTETSRVVDPIGNGPWFGRLVAFVDQNIWLDSNGAHVIKVDRFYLAYNRAKLHNQGTQEKQDLVTVVEEVNEQSEMRGGIAEGAALCVNGILCFEVCEYTAEEGIDFAWICIYTTDQPSCCESSSPSALPSEPPTLLPTVAPSALPSPSPSVNPTPGPPTSLPTESSTRRPTVSPSMEPTNIQPTVATSNPTDEPTAKSSTRNPTTEPSASGNQSPLPTTSPTEEKLTKKGAYPGLYEELHPADRRRKQRLLLRRENGNNV